MTKAWGAGEWITVIMFSLGGIWLLAKLLGVVVRLVRAPFVALFYHFVDERVFAGVNHLEDDDEDMSSQDTVEPFVLRPRTGAPDFAPNHPTPDTYQPNYGTARRTSTRRSDPEWIAELASAKAPDGKYRFTANAIAALVGGTRKDVLDQIRAIRNLPPEYPTLAAQQRPSVVDPAR